MKYALGNMLNGGGLNADGLSLDLQFAADKTLTARKGPTPVLTRGSTGTFVGSNGLIQTAAVNAARFDHDPVSPFACRGLLIEEGRTNLQPYSSDYTQTATAWSTTVGMNAAVLASTVSPDGTQNGVLVSESTASGVHRTSSASITGTAQPYTVSIFVKAGSSPRRYISFGFVFQNIRVIWDTQTSSFTGVTPGTTAPTSYSSRNFGNGWHRLIVTATPAAGSIGIGALFYNGAESYAGDGTSNIFFWGAQLEAGSFATSYIPTTTSALARSGDICTITGSDFTSFYNQSEGTIVGSGLTNSPTTNAGPELFRSNDGTSNNRIQLGMTNFPAQAIRPFIVASGTTTYSSTQGTATVGVERKVGTAYKTNDTISAFNGTLGTLDTTVTPPTNCNQVSLFAGLGGGTISSLRYFKKRLANAKLQALTA